MDTSIITGKKQGLKQLGLGILGTGLILTANAQESNKTEQESELQDMVVTATKTETPAEEIGYSMSVIDREKIENSNLTKVSDLLTTVRGIHYWSSGPHSIDETLSIRGMQGYHTKVLINGIPAQDSAGVKVMPMLNDLSLDNVEKIEIIRGASSTLYGSNAVAGVVNIITRKGEEETRGTLSTEFGSHQFQKYNTAFSGSEGIVDYAFSANFMSEEGISYKNDIDLNNDDDPFRNETYSAQIGFQLADNLRLNIFGRFSDADQEYDNARPASQYGPAKPDNGDVHIQRWMTGGSFSATDLLDFWDTKLSLSTVESRRGDAAQGLYEGDSVEFDWQNTFTVNSRNTTSLGYTYAAQDALVEINDLNESYYSNALYAQHQIEAVKNLFLTAGLRYNDHSEFGDETTYSTAVSYLVEETDTKLRASFSTGYRAPSLYELFAPATMFGTVGNPDLDPETSETWDIGFEQSLLNDKLSLGLTYFETSIDDYIGWSNGYNQIEGITSDGVESFVSYQLCDNLNIKVTHTYMDTENEEDGGRLIKRPRHTLTGDIVYSFCDNRGTAKVQAQHVGERVFYNNQSGDDYTLANLALSYDLTTNVELFGRVHNILDENYQVAGGYNTYDRTYYGGVKLSF